MCITTYKNLRDYKKRANVLAIAQLPWFAIIVNESSLIIISKT